MTSLERLALALKAVFTPVGVLVWGIVVVPPIVIWAIASVLIEDWKEKYD